MHFLVLFAALAAMYGSTGAGDRIALLDDMGFRRGFRVWSPKPGKKVAQGIIRPGDAAGEPVWGLAQWHSRFSFAGAEPERLKGGAVRFADRAKAVTFYPPGGKAAVAFALAGSVEYRGAAPRRGDPWPHLLAQRQLTAHPSMTDMAALHFAIRYRLLKAAVRRPDGFDPRRHTAQFVFYLTVQNRNRASAGFGDYFWFGVPLYDARHRLPPAHTAVDRGSDRKPATGKFIFTPAAKRYTSRSAHDGEWVTIEKDILPLVREGLKTAWRRGYLGDSREMADYRLGGMNTGWEVTGPLDVAMQVGGLRLEAVVETPTTVSAGRALRLTPNGQGGRPTAPALQYPVFQGDKDSSFRGRYAFRRAIQGQYVIISQSGQLE